MKVLNFIEGNKYGFIILKNTTLGVHRTQVMHRKCKGKQYDHQISHDMLN